MAVPKPHTNPRPLRGARAYLVLAALCLSHAATAAQTDISPLPMANGVDSVVLPNVMFVLDDSGSMDWNYLPDNVDDSFCRDGGSDNNSSLDECGDGDPPFSAAAFNFQYYDPTITYTPGVNADGTAMKSQTAANTANWTQVQTDPYRSPASTTNIVTNYYDVVWCDQSNRSGADLTNPNRCRRNNAAHTTGAYSMPNAFGHYAYPNNNYAGAGTKFQFRKELRGNPYYYKIANIAGETSNVLWCKSREDDKPTVVDQSWYGVPGACGTRPTSTLAGGGPFRYVRFGAFQRVDIIAANAPFPGPGGTTRTYAEEMTNFANWYAYYRTRMLMMKTAAGRAFSSIGSGYRVGFITINQASYTSRFLPVAPFDATQKAAWYSKFYAVDPNNSTPLREALSRVGRYYAGVLKPSGASDPDPIQYSCQQNFSILSTDGYWNGAAGDKLNGTSIGNQDNSLATAPRPFYDGNLTGASDTLADVAFYYYITDLRTSGSTGALGTDVSRNNVPGSGSDVASHQHMTTFTLGLGVDGELEYIEDYETATSGDFLSIKQGLLDWPVPPSTGNSPRTVDDLWHAAVNGRGKYFSAKSPKSLANGLASALAGVSARTGAAAAAATSNLEPVAGDNFAYTAIYRTVKWDGNLQARSIDLDTGLISDTVLWEAQALLDAKVGASTDTRTIYTFDATNAGGNRLKNFTWADLTAAERAYFNTTLLTQYASWSAAERTAATGTTLVDFIRGRTGAEDQAGNTLLLYRNREHTLGDIVNAQPAYARKPEFKYGDTGYLDFQSANASRRGMVYVAANDGMLHAFDATSGQESWAFVPTMVMPNLFRLADKDYEHLHQFYVDGSPAIGDICVSNPCAGSSDWRTILVGGLNAGGRGYYALDITNPDSPRALWQFSSTDLMGLGPDYYDQDMGLSYGNPVVTKLANGRWVVLVTSGYNNVTPGDGRGYLYVLDAYTGQRLYKIGTGVGDTTTPSGLGRINAWVDDTLTNNSSLRVYGADMLGNLWRFDINDTLGTAGREAHLLAVLRDGGGATQPVTTRPELGEVKTADGNKAVVFVATGRYLGTSDLVDTQQQTIYAIKDPLDATSLANARASLAVSTLSNGLGTSGQEIRTATASGVNFATDNGWYVDLPDSGERVNVDPKLQLGTLVIASNVPENDACSVGGYGWINYLAYQTGGPVSDASGGAAAKKVTGSLIVGMNIYKLQNNKVITTLTTARGDWPTVPVDFASPVPVGRRVSWTEVIPD